MFACYIGVLLRFRLRGSDFLHLFTGKLLLAQLFHFCSLKNFQLYLTCRHVLLYVTLPKRGLSFARIVSALLVEKITKKTSSLWLCFSRKDLCELNQ